MILKLLLILAVMQPSGAGAQKPRGQNAGECQFGGAEALDHDAKLISDAPTCSAADDKLHDCQWGSTADTRLAPIVIEKCEKIFLNKLSPSGKANYQHGQHLCAYEYAGQEGTLFISEKVVCEADVAEDFATHPGRTNLPIPRASFDCARARTPLEKAVCSDRALGDADIVLNRVYEGLLASATSAERPVVIRQQKGWLHQAIVKCGANTDPLPASSRDCIRMAFEDRFADLDGCAVGGVSECLNQTAADDR